MAADDTPPASGSVSVTPLEDMAIGPLDDFDPDFLQRTYVIANGTSEPLSLVVSVSKPWISLDGPANGIVAPGESLAVPVTVSPFTATLDSAASETADPAVGEIAFLDGQTGEILGTSNVHIGSNFELEDGDGWTLFTPSVDTRTVFVSKSSGNDQNDGLSPTTPKRTISAGVALLRHGFPDWLLLERGNTWHESLGQWKKSGRSASEPMLLATYGDAAARPLLRTGTVGGLWTHGGGGSPATIDHLAIVGLHFWGNGHMGGCVGAKMLQPGTGLLIEDCKFESYSTNLVFQGFGGRHSDYRLRRSVIVDAHTLPSAGEHSQGLYAYAVDGLLIEENVFDHNGWSETLPAAVATIYNHNLYIDNGNTDVVVQGNLIARGSSHGLQLRCGGTVVNNLFARNSISLLVGGGNAPEPDGVRAEVLGNVIIDGKDIDENNPRGWGIVLSNISSGRVAHNVVANNVYGSLPRPLILDGDAQGDNGPTIGIHETTIIGNIFYNWGGGVLVEGYPAMITSIGFSRNDLQNAFFPEPLLDHYVAGTTTSFDSGQNRFFNQAVPSTAWATIENVSHSIVYWMSQVGDTTSVATEVNYPHPRRTLSDYNLLLGGTVGFDAFMGETRQQCRTNWRLPYTAVQANRYFRAGF